jgi:hypothetical protein
MIGGRSALLAASGSKVAVPWTPASISLLAWCDSSIASTISLSGTAVTRWRTVTNVDYWFREDAGPILIPGGLNGKNVISLGSGSLAKGNPFLAGNVPNSLFVITRSVSLTGTNVIWNNNVPFGGQNGGGNQLARLSYGATITHTGTPNTNFHIFGYELDTPAGRLYYDGELVASGSGFGNTSAGFGNYLFGYYDPNFEIAEMVNIGYIPTTEIRNKVVGYLAHKWALTSNLSSSHPYKNSPPTV